MLASCSIKLNIAGVRRKMWRFAAAESADAIFDAGEEASGLYAADANFRRGNCSSWLYALVGTGLRSQMRPIQERHFNM
jgi:hypothetical protein